MSVRHFKDLKVEYCPLPFYHCYFFPPFINNLSLGFRIFSGSRQRMSQDSLISSHLAPHSSPTKMWPVIALNAIMTLTYAQSKSSACLVSLPRRAAVHDVRSLRLTMATMATAAARWLPVWQRDKGQGQLTRRCWLATGWRFSAIFHWQWGAEAARLLPAIVFALNN